MKQGLVEYVEAKSFEPPLVIEYDKTIGSVTFNGLKMKEYDDRSMYVRRMSTEQNVFNFLTKAN